MSAAGDGDLEGTRLGRYRVDRLLGSGGMGSVYAGVQEPLGRPVAIKVLRRELAADAEIVARFKREAELAASLSHPNIAQVTDFGVEDGRAFLVMDLLEGESLGALIDRERALPERRVQHLALQILAALETAHVRGVVHRDLKPENVFVQRVGGMDLVKLLDFGIARMVDGDSKMTSTGAVLGTPAYMSPEQARGKHVDARSDLFSLGALLYEAMTGRLPFSGTNYHELMFAVAEETPPPIEGALGEVVARAMQKRPDERFASATEMRETIAALGELSATPPVLSSRPPPPERDVSAGAFAATMASEPRAPAPAPAGGRRRAGIAAAIVGALALTGIAAAAIGLAGGGVGGGPSSGAAAPEGAVPTAALAGDPRPAIAPGTMQPLEASERGARGEPPTGERSGSRATTAAGDTAADDTAADDTAADETAADETAGDGTAGGDDRADEGTAASDTATSGAGAARTSDRLRGARIVRARCGTSQDEVELRVIGPRDRVRASSIAAIGQARSRSVSDLRRAADARSDALTACYRGHAMLNGQWYTLVVDAAGNLERVEPVTYCPIDPEVVSCVQRVLGEVPVDNVGDGPGGFRIGLDHGH